MEAPQAAIQITELKLNAAEIPWITWSKAAWNESGEEKLFLFTFGEVLLGVGYTEHRIRICLEFFRCVDADFLT